MTYSMRRGLGAFCAIAAAAAVALTPAARAAAFPSGPTPAHPVHDQTLAEDLGLRLLQFGEHWKSTARILPDLEPMADAPEESDIGEAGEGSEPMAEPTQESEAATAEEGSEATAEVAEEVETAEAQEGSELAMGVPEKAETAEGQEDSEIMAEVPEGANTAEAGERPALAAEVSEDGEVAGDQVDAELMAEVPEESETPGGQGAPATRDAQHAGGALPIEAAEAVIGIDSRSPELIEVDSDGYERAGEPSGYCEEPAVDTVGSPWDLFPFLRFPIDIHLPVFGLDGLPVFW